MRTGSPIPSRGPTIETRNQEDEIEHRRVDHRTPRQTWMNNNRIHMSPRVDNTACWPKGFEHGFMWVTTPCLKNTAFCACKAGQVLAGSKIHIPKIIRDPVASRAASPPPPTPTPPPSSSRVVKRKRNAVFYTGCPSERRGRMFGCFGPAVEPRPGSVVAVIVDYDGCLWFVKSVDGPFNRPF